MIDIHSHLLFDIDDGTKSLEESITLIKEAEKQGVKAIFLTPHYIKNSRYICNNQVKEKQFMILKKEVKRQKINIDLFLGNEIYFDKDIEEILDKKEIHFLGNSKYLLLEISLHNKENMLLEIIESLTKKGYKVIIAHPERYQAYEDELEFFEKIIIAGALLQGNMMSLLGTYGDKPKKVLKKLIKRRMITFIASDIHREKHNYYSSLPKIEKKLTRLVGYEQTRELLQENAKEIFII